MGKIGGPLMQLVSYPAAVGYGSMGKNYSCDPDHWRRLAAEARSQAEQMAEGKKRLMLKIARGYDQLAEQAEQRRKAGKPPEQS